MESGGLEEKDQAPIQSENRNMAKKMTVDICQIRNQKKLLICQQEEIKTNQFYTLITNHFIFICDTKKLYLPFIDTIISYKLIFIYFISRHNNDHDMQSASYR